jgi:lysophospholipase L1-like esterase
MSSKTSIRPASLVLFYAIFLVGVGGLGEISVRVYLAFNTVYDVEMTRYSNDIKVSSDGGQVFEHRPLAAARLMDVDLSINSDGLRDQEYPIESERAHRMIFLGDSLTLGWGVEQEDTFESLLEERFNAQGRGQVEILNFGIGNYNTAQEVALFAKKGLKYHPDKVVVFYFVNDAEPTPQASGREFLGHSRLITFYWSRVNILLSKYSRDGSFLGQYGDLYREGQPGWEATKASFGALRDLCDQHGIGLQVVLLPELHDLKNPPFRRQYAMVEAVLKSEAIPALDLTPHFSTVDDDPTSLWVALDDAHPNARAHKLIADFSQQFISPWSE